MQRYERLIVRHESYKSNQGSEDDQSSELGLVWHLSEAIQNFDIKWLQNDNSWHTVVNLEATIYVPTDLVPPDARQFYTALRRNKTTTGIPETTYTNVTPLVYSLFSCLPNKHATEAILDLLISAGADLGALDQIGLSAYDYARILRFDEGISSRLNPFPTALLAAIQDRNFEKILDMLRETYSLFQLDQTDRSPIALAVHIGYLDAVPILLGHGASPFAKYVDKDACYHSLALVSLLNNSLLTYHISLYAAAYKWIATVTRRDSTFGDNDAWVERCLKLMVANKRAWNGKPTSTRGDTVFLSALFNLVDLGRSLLGAGISGVTAYKGLPISDINSEKWSMYAAIRLGHMHFVSMLLNIGVEVDQGNLDGRHAISLQWPWHCGCPPHIHLLGTDSLRQYAERLLYVPLCDKCQRRRVEYSLIARVLKIPQRPDCSRAPVLQLELVKQARQVSQFRTHP